MSDFYQDMQNMVRDIMGPSDEGGLGMKGIRLIRTMPAGRDPARPWERGEASRTTSVGIRGAAKIADAQMIDNETVVAGDVVVTASLPIDMDWALDARGSLSMSLDGRPPMAVVGAYAKPPTGVPVSVVFVLRGSP